MDTIGINDWVPVCFCGLFFLKEAKSHILKKSTWIFNKTELAVSVLDDLEHSLTQIEKEGRGRA